MEIEVVRVGEVIDRLVEGVELNHLRKRIPVSARVEVLDSGRITIVHLKTDLEGEPVRVHGVARSCPEDKPQRDIGSLLAMGRALEHLGRKLQRRAWGQVKQVDHQRRHRETLKPRQASFLP